MANLRYQNAVRLLGYARPYRMRIIMGFICMIGVAALSAASAKMMKPIINDIFIARDATMLWQITGAVIGIFFFKGVFSYGESVLMAFVGHKVIIALQNNFYKKIVAFDLVRFQQYQAGDLVSRFINDVSKLNNAVTGTLSSIVKDFLTLIFFIAVMVSEDAQLFKIVLLVLPLAVLPVAKIGRWMRKTARKLQEQTSELTVFLTQSFQGIRLIKSYLLEKEQIKQLNILTSNIFERTFKGVKLKSATHPIMELLGGIAIALVIVYGGRQVINGVHTAGAFFAFITALIMSYEPMKRLANLHANFQEQMAAATRVFSIMDLPNNIVDSPTARPHTIHQGKIKLSHVNFYYHVGQPILHDINLTINAGEVVALVGPSGAGKSTLINILPRFFDTTSGEITIDDVTIADYTLASLRQQIAIVSQDIVLFNDTVMNNIRFGMPDARDIDVIDAARAAAAHDFILNLTQGYQTIVGDQGHNLSGGQRQRIAIARAILKNAPILLLDEPTSALDSESEQTIQNSLNKLMDGKTTIVIAHRLSTIRDADIIYVMDHGRIIDAGDHKTLMKTSSLYNHLSSLQLR